MMRPGSEMMAIDDHVLYFIGDDNSKNKHLVPFIGEPNVAQNYRNVVYYSEW